MFARRRILIQRSLPTKKQFKKKLTVIYPVQASDRMMHQQAGRIFRGSSALMQIETTQHAEVIQFTSATCDIFNIVQREKLTQARAPSEFFSRHRRTSLLLVVARRLRSLSFKSSSSSLSLPYPIVVLVVLLVVVTVFPPCLTVFS